MRLLKIGALERAGIEPAAAELVRRAVDTIETPQLDAITRKRVAV